MDRRPCVYMMASRRNGTIYAGMTGNLPGRVRAHREGHYVGFTRRYKCDKLVWYEFVGTFPAAIAGENTLKNSTREDKKILIDAMNPEWLDLYESMLKSY